MLRKFKGISPEIDKKAHVFESAEVIGMVTMKEYSSVWPNCTVRGDVNRIEIGKYSNIQDNSCLHVADQHACIVGDYVTVGHCATLHACTIKDHVLIGMGSVILDGSVIGEGSVVAAGAVDGRRTCQMHQETAGKEQGDRPSPGHQVQDPLDGRVRHPAGRRRRRIPRGKDPRLRRAPFRYE